MSRLLPKIAGAQMAHGLAPVFFAFPRGINGRFGSLIC